jgi:hypothetical protein
VPEVVYHGAEAPGGRIAARQGQRLGREVRQADGFTPREPVSLGEHHVEVVGGPQHPPPRREQFGARFTLTKRRLRSGERLVLLTDGIVERKMEGGGAFGPEGIRQALECADSLTAASTRDGDPAGVTQCWDEPLEGGATVVIMAVE